MGKVRIPYYVVPKGKRRGYWRPTPRMKALGFMDIRCGPDGPAAWAIAQAWNERWQRARRGEPVSFAEQERRTLSREEAEELAIYPDGSVGYAFRRYRRMPEIWPGKAEATRNDWWRGWRHIKPILADVDPSTIEPEMMAKWYGDLKREHGLREAHRALKIWRALWKVMAAFHLCERDKDPSMAVRNKTPKGRTATFSEGEAVRLIKQAWRDPKKRGLACIMAVAWDTQFSPVDCRMVAPRHWFTDETGSFFVKLRKKMEETDEDVVEAIDTLSKRTERIIETYVAEIGTEFFPDAPIFRNEGGTAYSKDTLCRSFRKNLRKVFPGDKRKLIDFRRSGAVEAQAGQVDPLALATKMANSINHSKVLQDTYLPKRATTVRLADGSVAGRRYGRTKRDEKLQLAGPKSCNRPMAD